MRCSGEPEVLAAELTTVAEARGRDLAAVFPTSSAGDPIIPPRYFQEITPT